MLLAAGLLSVLASCGSDDPPRPEASTWDCPAPTDPVWDATTVDETPLAAEVRSVRLCYRGGGHPWQTVPDTVRGDAAADLAGFVDGLGPKDVELCNMTPRAALIDVGVAFGYPDGSVRVLTANPTECGGIVVDGVPRSRSGAAENLITTFLDAVAAQRADAEAVIAEPIDLDCSVDPLLHLSLLPWPEDLRIRRAEACISDLDGVRRSVPLTAEQVRALQADINGRRVPRPEDVCDQGYIVAPRVGTGIYLESEHGDRFYSGSTCYPDFHLGSSPGYSSGTQEGWTPGPELRVLLDGLRAAAGAP